MQVPRSHNFSKPYSTSIQSTLLFTDLGVMLPSRLAVEIRVPIFITLNVSVGHTGFRSARYRVLSRHFMFLGSCRLFLFVQVKLSLKISCRLEETHFLFLELLINIGQHLFILRFSKIDLISHTNKFLLVLEHPFAISAKHSGLS